MAICTTCDKGKAPRGRSIPAVMYGTLCDDDCSGFYDEPSSGDHWPDEECADTKADPGVCQLCRLNLS